MPSPKIILYTDKFCPWTHRVYMALKETGLDYEEVIVNITKPREPWYLEINPKGLVPAVSYNGTNIIESAAIAQLIVDAHPSHLLPPSSPTDNAVYTARLSLFVGAFASEVIPNIFAGIMPPSEEECDAVAEKMVDGIATEVEPLLLAGEGPFYGGRLTLAEVQCAPFIIRMLALSKPEHGIFSTKLPELLEKVPQVQALG